MEFLIIAQTVYYLVVSLAIIVLGILLMVTAYHLIHIARHLSNIADSLDEVSDDLKVRIEHIIAGIASLPVLGYFLNGKKKKK